MGCELRVTGLKYQHSNIPSFLFDPLLSGKFSAVKSCKEIYNLLFLIWLSQHLTLITNHHFFRRNSLQAVPKLFKQNGTFHLKLTKQNN